VVKVIVNGENLLYSNWLPLITKDSTSLVGLINTFRGIFRTKGITIVRPPTTGTTLFLQVPDFPRPEVAFDLCHLLNLV